MEAAPQGGRGRGEYGGGRGGRGGGRGRGPSGGRDGYASGRVVEVYHVAQYDEYQVASWFLCWAASVQVQAPSLSKNVSSLLHH